jgi:hypothetical protein
VASAFCRDALDLNFVLTCYWFCPAEPPAAKPALAQDETIINPYYMRQLLSYGIKLGQQPQHADMDPEELLKEAEVRFLLACVNRY